MNRRFYIRKTDFKKEESAQDADCGVEGTGSACGIRSETGTPEKRAPLLFNLAELQAECSKRFKISPDETLQVAQDLYEKKLTTYPRTDARVLSTAVAKEITKNISRLKDFAPVAPFCGAHHEGRAAIGTLRTRSIRMIPRLPTTTRSFRPDSSQSWNL